MADPKFCIQCGTPLEPGQKFCSNCGANIADLLGQDDVTEEPIAAVDVETSPEASSEPVSSDDKDYGASSDGSQDSPAAQSDEPVEEPSAPKDSSEDEAASDTSSKGDTPSESSKDDSSAAESADEASPVQEASDDASLSGLELDDALSAEAPTEPVNPSLSVAGTDPFSSVPDVPGASEVAASPTQQFAPVAAPPASPSSTAPMPLVMGGGQAYRNDTQVMQTVDAAPRTYRQEPTTGSAPSAPVGASGGGRQHTALIVVIIVLAVVLVVLIGVLVFNMMNSSSQTDDTQQAEQEQVDTTSDQQQADPAPAPTTTPTSSADRTIYSSLSTCYDHLSSYDQDIADAADDFNANYMSTDMSTRNLSAYSANTVYTNVTSEYNYLKGLSVPSTSEYYGTYNNLLTCYYDCQQRISVICEAWDISLSYADPTGHSDEICKPLARDRVNNTNKYYTEFQSVYPNAKPAAPRD